MLMIPPVICLWFPYYIVRFKHQCKVSILHKISFPYYIVRFKQSCIEQLFFSRASFHTTQYDLNSFNLFRVEAFTPCFHTTQYDLNHIKHSSLFSCSQFPYYIVRFKPCGGCMVSIIEHSFHTTQYDLNLYRIPLEDSFIRVSILHSTI